MDVEECRDDVEARMQLSANELETISYAARCSTSGRVGDVLVNHFTNNLRDAIHRECEKFNLSQRCAFLRAEHSRDAFPAT